MSGAHAAWLAAPDPSPARQAPSLAAEFPYTPSPPLPRRGRHRKSGAVSRRFGAAVAALKTAATKEKR